MLIEVDTHSHTVASTHAYSTVGEYVQQAKAKGLKMISLTEHGPQMPDSPHPWHFGNRSVIPRVIDGIGVLRGIEANILPDNGKLDIPKNLHPYLDFAIASFHEPVFPPKDKATHTRAVINAIQSGQCQIIGHPGNPNYPLDYEEVIRAAKDANVLIEINNSSFTHSRVGSEENCTRIMELVDTLDWQVVFSSDAHIAYHVGDTHQCEEKAAAVDFPLERVVNTSAKRFLQFLESHDKNVGIAFEQWLKAMT
ncbi:phosphatase [Aestuariibacter sp. AA17]|uniref:Phosphatase n=1 Tax=Fluctibacter corallii TaxID=2984329 RepID=A0ABT3AAM4_9ALTE|nr:phosphatase [Aestuariibacter sp. AA17]MCV2885709.1 phosphatase [Aestuariibacter sp. AA17]